MVDNLKFSGLTILPSSAGLYSRYTAMMSVARHRWSAGRSRCFA